MGLLRMLGVPLLGGSRCSILVGVVLVCDCGISLCTLRASLPVYGLSLCGSSPFIAGCPAGLFHGWVVPPFHAGEDYLGV